METRREEHYLRISDQEQLEDYSMDAQLRALHNLCRQRDWEPVAVCKEDVILMGDVNS